MTKNKNGKAILDELVIFDNVVKNKKSF